MFNEILEELRKEKRITQRELAAKLGIARTTYSGYENGTRQPDQRTLNKIADYFGVSVDYLLGRTKTRGYLTDENAKLLAEKITELPENKRRVIEELLKSYED